MGGDACIVKSALLLFTFISLFTSCDNFLNNGNVKDEILDIIAYNNAPSSTILFRADDGTGTFLTANEKSIKVGYEDQAEFELNKDNYLFVGFEAVAKLDTTQSREDCVEITPVSSDEKKGVYTVSIKVLKEVNDVIIRPKCILIPALKGISPKFESSGCDQDKPIIFEFNKPVNIESVKTKAKLDIYSDAESLKEYFKLSDITFSTDGKTMSISTTDKLLLPPDNEKNTMTVFVNYDFSEALDLENQKMNIKGTYEYRVNKTYGDQVKVKVYAQSDSGIQLSLNEGEYKDCTVGYSTDINYTFDSLSYYFAGFEAVKYSDPQVNVDSLVSVESIMINQSSGAYKAHIKVLDGTDDILIKIKTVEFPAVSAHEPATSTEEINSHKPIIITFNTPVEAEDVLAENSLFNYNNILLTCKDSSGSTIDVSQYFKTPSFNKQKTKLTISPKPLELEGFIANTLNTTDVILNVYLKDTIIISKAGKDFTLKQDANTNFNVCYNTDLETVKPSKKEFFATKDVLKLSDNSVANCTKLSFLNPNSMNAEQMFQNRVKDTIYIYGNYYDKDSGVSKVSVGVDDNEPEIIDLTSANAEFLTDDEGNTKFCIKCNLNLNNGAYCIKVNVLDACNNPSDTESFYVISKKTYSREEIKFNIENGPFEHLETSCTDEKQEAFRSHLEEIGLSAFVQEYNNLKKQIRVYETSYYYGEYIDEDPDDFTSEDSHIVLYENAQAKAKYSIKAIKLYCEYVDKNNQIKKQEFSAFDVQKGYRSLELDLDTIYGESITIIAEDDFGAQGAFDVTFPVRTDGYIYTYGDHFYFLDSPQHKFFLIGAEVDENDIETGQIDFMACYYEGGSCNEPAYTDKLWYFYWSYDEYGNALCGDLFNWNDTASEELEVNYVITKDENNHAVVTFNFAEDTWEKFDEIKFYPENLGYNSNHKEEHIIEKGTMSFIYARGNNYYTRTDGSKLYFFYEKHSEYSYGHYSSGGSFEFVGYKKDYLLGNKSISFNDLGIDKVEYDDIPPIIEKIAAEELDKITFIVEDDRNIYKEDSLPYGAGAVTEGGQIKIYDTKTGRLGKIINLSERDVTENGSTKKQCYGKVNFSEIKKYFVYEGKNIKLPYTYTVKDAAGNITQDCSAEVTINTTDAYCREINVEEKSFEMNGLGTYSIYRLDAQQRAWQTVPLKDPTETYSTTYLYATDDYNVENITNAFIKFSVFRNNGAEWSTPRIQYSGSAGTGNVNYMFKNGTARSVVVCSDAPVFIHRFKTDVPFEICKNWTTDQWMFLGEETIFPSYLIDFQEGNTTPKVVDLRNNADNYVVIAHFANGDTIMVGPVETDD
jgi:hypothetical protein